MFRQWNFPGPSGALPVGCFAAMLIAGLLIAAQFGLVATAFERLGLTAGEGIVAILAMLFTSRLNIPLYRSRKLVKAGLIKRTMRLGGFQMTSMEQGDGELVRQSFAISVGGALIPGLISLWLFLKIGYTMGLFGTMLVTVVASYAMASPRQGIGFGVPFIGPALATALAAHLLAGPAQGPACGWIAGATGTVLGAHVLRLFDQTGLEQSQAPVVAIGGPGVFGAALLAGLAGVLLA